MNEQLVQENKLKLEAEAKRLREILGRSSTHDGDGEFPGEFKPKFQEGGNDNEENASEVEQFVNDLGVTQDLEAQLIRIEAALKRIADGTYGQCKGGDEISEERLRAVPEAETCVKHAV